MRIPPDQPFDLAEVMGKLVREKQLAGYEVRERFYEMGSPAGLADGAWRKGCENRSTLNGLNFASIRHSKFVI